jgi:hypothetical protein
MYLSIFESGQKAAAAGLSIDPASFYQAYEQVRDGRKKKGKRYPLPLLLTLLMLGKLARETTVSGTLDTRARGSHRCICCPSMYVTVGSS